MTKMGGREIILLTARIRFVVSRKEKLLPRPPLCCVRNEVQSGHENDCTGCRGRGLSKMSMCREHAQGRWGDTTSISPSSYLDCLGSLRRQNVFVERSSQERQDEAES